MTDERIFYPPRRVGLGFHVAAILLLFLAAGAGLWQASQASIGPIFLLSLLPILVAVVVLPVLGYRVYALRTAAYTLEREGIRLRWGLRFEDIPMTSVQWLFPARELAIHLPLPWTRWPGAVLGIRHLAGTGDVEFLAARSNDLVLIATPERIFAVSPADTSAFLNAYQRYTEMGSLTPIPGRSVYPTFLLARVWNTFPARVLLLAGLFLSLLLLVWISLAIPARDQIRLGFNPDGSPGIAVPAVRLLLLPLINSFFVLIDLFAGLFFFRHEESQPFSYLLWGSGAITPFLFLIATFLVLKFG